MTEDEEKYPNRYQGGGHVYWNLPGVEVETHSPEYDTELWPEEGLADRLINAWVELGYTTDGVDFVRSPGDTSVTEVEQDFYDDAPFDTACSDTVTDLYNLLCQKQHDYGSSNILDSIVDPQTALLVRLGDKFARLKNLHQKNREAKNETVRDTVVDIAGYAVLLLMVMDGTFPRE